MMDASEQVTLSLPNYKLLVDQSRKYIEERIIENQIDDLLRLLGLVDIEIERIEQQTG